MEEQQTLWAEEYVEEEPDFMSDFSLKFEELSGINAVRRLMKIVGIEEWSFDEDPFVSAPRKAEPKVTQTLDDECPF